MSSGATSGPLGPMSTQERLALASDPVTPPERLTSLYADWLARQPTATTMRGSGMERLREEPEVAEALAANPNTPPDTLIPLAAEFPAAFCRNPAAPLVPLEASDFAERLGPYGVARLLRLAEAPREIVRLITTQAEAPDSRAEAALHVALAGESGDGWEGEMRVVLFEHSRTSPRMQSAEARRALRDLVRVGCAPAYLLPDLPPGPAGGLEAVIAATLFRPMPDGRLSPPLCRAFALAHPSTLGRTLQNDAGSLFWLERLGVALNPNAAALPGVLDPLAEDGNRLVRAAARSWLRGEDTAVV